MVISTGQWSQLHKFYFMDKAFWTIVQILTLYPATILIIPTFCAAFYLTVCLTYSLTYCPAFYLAPFHAFIPASILTFYLAFYLASAISMPSVLTFFLIVFPAFCLTYVLTRPAASGAGKMAFGSYTCYISWSGSWSHLGQKMAEANNWISVSNMFKPPRGSSFHRLACERAKRIYVPCQLCQGPGTCSSSWTTSCSTPVTFSGKYRESPGVILTWQSQKNHSRDFRY